MVCAAALRARKRALAALTGLSSRSKFLVVLERTDSLTWLSLRNATEVHLVHVDQLNTYDVLVSDDVVFTKDAFESFVAAASKKKQEDSPVFAPRSCSNAAWNGPARITWACSAPLSTHSRSRMLLSVLVSQPG